VIPYIPEFVVALQADPSMAFIRAYSELYPIRCLHSLATNPALDIHHGAFTSDDNPFVYKSILHYLRIKLEIVHFLNLRIIGYRHIICKIFIKTPSFPRNMNWKIITILLIAFLLVSCGKKETPTGGAVVTAPEENQPKTVVTEEVIKKPETVPLTDFCEGITLQKLRDLKIDANVLQAVCDTTNIETSQIQKDMNGNLLVQVSVKVADAEIATSDMTSSGINVMSTINGQNLAEITIWATPEQIKGLTAKDYVVLIHTLTQAS